LYFESENLWFHVSCVKKGAPTWAHELTVKVTVTVWLTPPLVPVTLMR